MTKVLLDFHKSRKTNAKTTWFYITEWKEPIEINDKMPTYKYSNKEYNKTHWEELHEISPNTKLIRVRVSNRGNITAQLYEVTIQGLQFIKILSENEIPEQILNIISGGVNV
ncbi:MAG: hypothetical protein QXY65_06670 [Candidatus Methanomethylicaceae archaeon]